MNSWFHRLSAGAEEEHSHPDCEAVGDLFEDDGAVAVGDLAVNFHAAINRTGMHDHGVGLEPGEALLVQAEHRSVFADAWEERLALAFVLDAEQVDHVGVAQGVINVVCNAAPKLFEHARHKR